MTSLTKANKKMGQLIVAEAQAKVNSARQKKAVEMAASIISQRDQAVRDEKWCSMVKDFLNRKIEALEKGQFDYVELWDKITFSEKELNESQPPRP